MIPPEINNPLKDPSQDGCCVAPGATLRKGSFLGQIDMTAGWIKLHRSIADHWIYQDPEKLKWWIDLLLMANHQSKKVLIKNNLIDCDRGQMVRSLESLSLRWLKSKKTVSTFLKLLQEDHMIELENIQISTRITICNYDRYQDTGSAMETERKQDGNAMETERKRDFPTNNKEKNVKKEKNDKNEKNGIDPPAANPLHALLIQSYCDWYLEKVGVKYKFQSGADGAAVKSIISYIRLAQKEKNGEEPSGEDILNAFQFILNKYSTWEPFYQKQLKLTQFDSNLPNIMANIKGINGKNTKRSPAEIISNIDAILAYDYPKL